LLIKVDAVSPEICTPLASNQKMSCQRDYLERGTHNFLPVTQESSQYLTDIFCMLECLVLGAIKNISHVSEKLYMNASKGSERKQGFKKSFHTERKINLFLILHSPTFNLEHDTIA
jgi:hypothetical protein